MVHTLDLLDPFQLPPDAHASESLSPRDLNIFEPMMKGKKMQKR